MNKIHKSFFAAEPGQIVSSNGGKYRITHLVSLDSVFAVDLATNDSKRLRIDSLEPAIAESECVDEAQEGIRDLALYSAGEWADAQRKLQAIKPLLENPLRTRADADAIARQYKVHTATLYKWLRTFQSAGNVSALVSDKRGRKKGTRLLQEPQEQLIQSVIEDEFLTKQRKNPQVVIDEVNRRARLAKVAAPHANTIRKRVAALPTAETLRRRGHKEIARNAYEPIKGEFPGADFPLAVVQIDHTPCDIILVDETHRKPIGRPWLTVAIDVFSRMIVGFYLTFEKPSATSVAMCVAQAICAKRNYLAELDINGEWPVWGSMTVIHVDNAKEFRGAVLERGCEEYHIDLQWRPVLRPHYGGHIERLVGTLTAEHHKLPGTTFSNTAKRKGYNSEAEAVLTLQEFERHQADFIVNVYHQKRHSELGMPPRKKWELGILGDATTPGVGIPPVPADPRRVQLDFMPYFNRSVQQYGLLLDHIFYYHPVLDQYINSTDPENPKVRRQFLVRRDPRDISEIYFFDPYNNSYVQVPYRNIGLPAMSVWELKEIQRDLKAKGILEVDEDTIFEALGRMRALVEGAVEKSKAARRQATRKPKATKPAQKPERAEDAEMVSTASAPAYSNAFEDDPFAQPIKPFDDVSVSR